MKISTDIGKLNQRISIQKKTVISDDIGNQTEEWTKVHDCWAAVNTVSGREFWAARQQNEENTVNFKVRYCKKIAEIGTVDYRIIFHNKIYDIISVDNMLFADSLINVKAVMHND